MRHLASTLVLLATCLSGGVGFAGEYADGTSPSGSQAAASRWKADAVLHESMEHIEAAVQGYEHYEHGHMNREQAEILAGLIDTRVATIISNCRLEPAADAALHEVLHALLEGATALKKEPTSAAAIASMRTAVASYRTLFTPPVAPLAPVADEPEERR